MAKELTKYELFERKAQAISTVGNYIAYCINDKQNDIKYYETGIAETIAQNEGDPSFNPDEDWHIENYRDCIAKANSVILLWQKLEKALEKEMCL